MPSRRTDLDHQTAENSNYAAMQQPSLPDWWKMMRENQYSSAQRAEAERFANSLKDEVKSELMSGQRDIAGTSLLPIKGISSAMKSKLTELGLFDVPSLLVYGRSRANRKTLSDKLDIDSRYVDSWLKQADLWRVPGMTPDIAYLLVQAGIRCVEDLAEVDVMDALPILKSLGAVQPDFTPPTNEVLERIVEEAKRILTLFGASSNSLELPLNDPDPTYLKRVVLTDQRMPSRESFSAIQTGFQNLRHLQLENYQALPSKIRGQVVCRDEDVFKGANKDDIKKAFSGAGSFGQRMLNNASLTSQAAVTASRYSATTGIYGSNGRYGTNNLLGGYGGYGSLLSSMFSSWF